MFGGWMIGIDRNDDGITIEYWRNKEILLYLVSGHRLAMSCKWICEKWKKQKIEIQIQLVDIRIERKTIDWWRNYLTENGPIFTIAVHMQSNLFDTTDSRIDGAFGDAKRVKTAND